MKKADLLKNALGIVEQRGLTYGKPENNFDNIASLWSVYLQQREAREFTDISPTDVAVMMVLMKVARLMEKPDHLDSWNDIAGYAACGAEVSRAGEPAQDELPIEMPPSASVGKIVPGKEHRDLKVGDVVVPNWTTPSPMTGEVLGVSPDGKAQILWDGGVVTVHPVRLLSLARERLDGPMTKGVS